MSSDEDEWGVICSIVEYGYVCVCVGPCILIVILSSGGISGILPPTPYPNLVSVYYMHLIETQLFLEL